MYKNDFTVATVVFTANHRCGCPDKAYYFRTFIPLEAGDIVVVDTRYGFQLATVTGCPDISTVPESFLKKGLKEVVCKADFTAYNERKAKAERVKALKTKMNSRISKLRETILYESMAEKDPELAAMLEELKSLT